MLSVSYRGAYLVTLAVAVSGCFNFDFGLGDGGIEADSRYKRNADHFHP